MMLVMEEEEGVVAEKGKADANGAAGKEAVAGKAAAAESNFPPSRTRPCPEEACFFSWRSPPGRGCSSGAGSSNSLYSSGSNRCCRPSPELLGLRTLRCECSGDVGPQIFTIKHCCLVFSLVNMIFGILS